MDSRSVPTEAQSIIRIPSRSHVDSTPLPTDSLISVSLTDPDPAMESELMTATVRATARPDTKASPIHRSSFEIMGSDAAVRAAIGHDKTDDGERVPTPVGSQLRPRGTSVASEDSGKVDWEELDRTEEREQRDEGTDESTAFLLARLEQENNAIATNPKAVKAARSRAHSRPPSIHQLRKLISNPDSACVRFSQLPTPPPMTEQDFWAALVINYLETAQRLPTLTSKKIRSGIPHPLRGMIWISISGARDSALEDQFDRLSGAKSPYENMIGKDVGRSFPGVEKFRDPQGEGQKMLGSVLRCFSLYDERIGYCQGLGFLVGPLLMHMGDKEAFCVLVRLMEHYDLRSCFLPDLSGLHLRIYQFQHLLSQHMPQLAAHLQELQVEAAYLSQWFLSFFAVTCPLPMLFRIYDVIFAEGASETIMRVALSLMRRNEKKILAFKEFEDVMQLLLSRALWDPYHLNADDLVDDFVGLTGVVTHERLQTLEAAFKESQSSDATATVSALPDVQATASRFLGRLWSPSPSAKSASLNPNSLSAPSRPVSFLRRSSSKQSIASTLNSTESSYEAIPGTNSTALTEVSLLSRGSTMDSWKSHSDSPMSGSKGLISNRDRDLHGQIEDLLTALNDLQRDHTALAAQLQKEREERADDGGLVRSLVSRLWSDGTPGAMAHRRRTVGLDGLPARTTLSNDTLAFIDVVSSRFTMQPTRNRTSQVETKQTLRESLAHTKSLLDIERLRTQSLEQQLQDHEQRSQSMQEQLREARSRIQDSHRDRQRLERTIQDLKSRKPSQIWSDSASDVPSLTRSDTTDSVTSANGLREFRLGRSPSKRSQATVQHQSQTPQTTTFAKRTSSLSARAVLATENNTPIPEDALLLELVNAKTAEAVARQELDEVKAKLDALRKMIGNPSQSTPGSAHRATPSENGGGFVAAGITSKATMPSGSVGGGGFWGWGKRSVSSSTVGTVTEGR